MARRTHLRSPAAHRLVAGNVLRRHQEVTGEPIALPIPIEMIIERTYDLTISWEEIDEPDGYRILGALSPSERTIVMNARHVATFERWIGPEQFTYAHELAHWLYDAGDANQQTLEFGSVDDVFCRHDDTCGLDTTTRMRERNANALAAHLLLPDELVLAADLDSVLDDIEGAARDWRVSRTTLRIKLEELGILGGDPRRGRIFD